MKSKIQIENSDFNVSSLSAYYKQVGKYPLLTTEQERELSRKWRKTGDRKYLNKLVTANLRFVIRIALEYKHYGIPLQDLIQEGNIGLIRGCERFDPDMGYRLISYAVWWIRAHIQEYILRNWSLVKLGTTQLQRRVFNALQSSQRRLRILLETEDPQKRLELLSKQLSASPEVIQEIELRIVNRDVSLDSTVPGTDDDLTLHDRLASDEDIENEVATKEARQKTIQAMLEFVKQLPERERKIVTERYLTDRQKTLRELGEEFGVSKERIRQLENRALGRIRTHLTEEVKLAS